MLRVLARTTTLRAPALTNCVATSARRALTTHPKAIGIVVDAEIDPARVDEFLEVMEADAKGSRDEPGCLRFDVLRASENRFFFYEVYVDADAVDVHKAQPHFKLWSDFKASGGVIKSVSTKASFPGWGLQE